MEGRELSLEDKLQFIEKSDNLGAVPFECFPPVQSDEYYFVSYSHKDYKRVFRDIFGLQNNGKVPISIWYDSGLSAGVDWEIEADKHIYDYRCKGVIFYVSENSVRSRSIHKEIEYVKKSGKSYLSVNLPVESVDGRAGEYLSAEELLRLLQPDLPPDDEKLRTLSEVFNERVTYLKFSDDIDRKIKDICSLKRPPLLVFEKGKNSSLSVFDGNYAVLTAVNDTDLKSVTVPQTVVIGGKELPVRAIGSCAFANCRRLGRVELPDGLTEIGSRAFYACESLKEINMKNVETVGRYAFFGCKSLEKVVYGSKCGTLPEGVFEGCSALTDISFPTRVVGIDDRAFFDCERLTVVNLSDKDEYGERFRAGNNLIHVGKNVFDWCVRLERIEAGSGLCYESSGGILYKRRVRKGGGKRKSKLRARYRYGAHEKLFIRVGLFSRIKKPELEICVVPKGITGDVKIPDGIKAIPDNAFEYCTRLETVDLNGVRTIGENAFYNSGLTEIVLPDGVKEIGGSAFCMCNEAKKIFIPDSVKYIGERAFSYRGMTEIRFGGSVARLRALNEKCVNWLYGRATVACKNGEEQAMYHGTAASIKKR